VLTHHAMKVCWGSSGIAPHILTSAVDGGEWSASRPFRFTPGTHWIGGWVGPRSGLDAMMKRKKSHHCPCTELNPSYPARSLLPTLAELPQLLTDGFSRVRRIEVTTLTSGLCHEISECWSNTCNESRRTLLKACNKFVAYYFYI
jgi:hypothetical protein